MSANSRIQEIVDRLFSGNKKQFADTVGLSPQYIQSILGVRKSKPSHEAMQKIGNSIENLNSDWLIYGTGQMMKTQKASNLIDLDRLDLILELSKAMKQNNEMLSESLVEAKNEIADLKKQLAQKDKDAEQIRTDYRAILKEKDKTIAEMGEELLKYSDSTTTGESELSNVG